MLSWTMRTPDLYERLFLEDDCSTGLPLTKLEQRGELDLHVRTPLQKLIE